MSNSVIGALRVVLGMDSASFDRGVTGAQRRINRFSRDMQAMGSRLTGIGARMSVGITAPFVALVAASIPAAVEARQAMGQVESALASMGNASGRTAAQLKASSRDLMLSSLYDDDQILREVTSNLLTFGNVAGEQFDRAQQAIVNLSARMNGDLQGATIRVGRALQNPLTGMNALTRSGIIFTEQQKAQIREMMRAGDVAGAQGLILAELERQFDGAAQAMRDADPSAALRNSWDDFKEQIGEIALRALPPLLSGLSALFDRFAALPPGMQTTLVAVVGITAAVGPLLIVLGSLVSSLPLLIPMFTGLSNVLGVALYASISRLLIAVPALAGTFAVLRTAMAFLLGPWGLVIAGIAAAIYALVPSNAAAAASIRATAAAADQAEDSLEAYRDAATDAGNSVDSAGQAASVFVGRVNVSAVAARAAAAAFAALGHSARQAAADMALGRAEQASSEAAALRARAEAGAQGRRSLFTGARGAGPAVPTPPRDSQAIRNLEREAEAQRQLAAEISSTSDAEHQLRMQRIASAGAPGAGGGGTGAAPDAGGGRDAASGPSAAERAYALETLRLQDALVVAQAQGDEAQIAALERQIALRDRIKAYEDAHLSTAAATVAATRVQEQLDAARVANAARLARETAGLVEEREEGIDLQIAELRGQQQEVDAIEQERELRALIAGFMEDGLNKSKATLAAEQALLAIEEARAANRARMLADQQQDFELELARARGDDTSGLEASIRQDRRIRELMTDQKMSEAEATAQAMSEGAQLAQANLQGTFRTSFREGLRAALDGNLGDAFENWMKERLFNSLAAVLDRLADELANLISSAKGGAGGDGGFFGFIGRVLGLVAPAAAAGGGGGGWVNAPVLQRPPVTLPGFASGGALKVGGNPGTDTNLLSINGQPAARINTGETLGIIPRGMHQLFRAFLDGFKFPSLPGFASGAALPGFAHGGSIKFGGFPSIDRNILALNGSPIAQVDSGKINEIRKGGVGGRDGPIDVRVRIGLDSDMLTAHVESVAAPMAVRAVAAARVEGAKLALKTIGRRQRRSLA